VYRGKDRRSLPLFEELFPFGGKLDENNRWPRIAELIPWEELESVYSSYFSDIGRPALDSRLVVGLFLLKHMTGLSDREVVWGLQENPYWQLFCGLESFAVGSALDPSSLTKLRKRLGAEYFRQLEELTYKVLVDRKIIKSKGMLVDATVFSSNVKYPNDVGLLNDVREWLVGQVKNVGKRVGKKYRTYCRKAKQTYLSFAKKKNKTKKAIRRSQRQMLQYVRRNIKQFKDGLERLKVAGEQVKRVVIDKLEIAERIYTQQLEMYKNKTHRVKDRIVSFCRPYVRPIVRGKNGRYVEFGPKAALTHVDGFLFLDFISHDNFAEADTGILSGQIESYENRFGRKPASLTGDRLYGNRANRALLDEQGIRSAFAPLGRKERGPPDSSPWFKRKQRERNRIEGHFGNGKQHYRLDSIRYQGNDGEQMWVRAGILAMNLKAAMVRM
jgi:IS5 family transposase